ncbi:MAG: class I SAM-dependent rRNA methyltransferase [Myxococcales bacterium]|nr:class I SAM-dependent rRNA methyltransferase [Myxococcales bacterium]
MIEVGRGEVVRALSLALERRRPLIEQLRAAPADARTDAYRLLHRAADGLDWLAVDRYGDYGLVHLFVELEGPALEKLQARVLEALAPLELAGVYRIQHPRQKNELASAPVEQLAPPAPIAGQRAPAPLLIHEAGLCLETQLGAGLRTGIFLDQRDNRARISALSKDKRVLNLFAYSGGFSLAALAGGASEAISVDVSQRALKLARANVERLGASDRHRVWKDDVFEVLARQQRRGERFDVIVLDPPSYATTRGRRFQVSRDYAELCAQCMAVLSAGGQLLCCVNHHGMAQRRLRGEIRAAAERAGRSIAGMSDLLPPLDFPAACEAEPLAKSVLVMLD